MNISYTSVILVDITGSLLMIILSFMCMTVAVRLRRKDTTDVMWLYLLWFSLALTVFAVSRSAGHLIKQLLLFSGHDGIWAILRPYSGAINTIAFIVAAAVTFFSDQIWKINLQTLKDKKDLQKAHGELLFLNENLERRVAQRTEALVQAAEQKMEMEKNMAQTEKLAAIGELSAGVAHEINNPLGVILGYNQLLLRGEEKGSEKHEDLKTIEKHVKHVRTIVSDLLSFSRNSKTERGSVDIHDIADEVIGFIRKHLGGGNIEVVKNYAPDLPRLLLDREKIKQVFVNLLMNAWHALEGSGTLTISTSLDAEKNLAVITVSDTGMGIEQENLTRIFDPFFTTKPTGQGTGLGLSVSYGIIKNHDGEISVASRPGQGTVFTITLPLHSREQRG